MRARDPRLVTIAYLSRSAAAFARSSVSFTCRMRFEAERVWATAIT